MRMARVELSGVFVSMLVLLPVIALWRLAGSSELSATELLAALGGDAAVVSVMLLLFMGSRSSLGRWPKAASFSRFLLAIAGVSLLAALVVGELLYQRTGEVLDVEIIRFALEHSGDVQGAVSSALTPGDFATVVFALAVLITFLVATKDRWLLALKGTLLLLPWGTLCAHALFDAWAFDESQIAQPVGEYQGRYANWKTDHAEWLRAQSTWYRRGLLTGLVGGKVLSSFDTEFLEDDGSARYSPYIYPSRVVVPGKPYNVLVISLESIRHDVVGAYRTEKASLTPFIDSLARNGWRVDRAYSTIPHTSKALVGILCGAFPAFSPHVEESRPGGIPIMCLPTLLASAGYATGHFQTAPAEFENRTGLLNNMGFETQMTQSSFSHEGWQRFGYISMDDRALVKPAAAWMTKQHREGKPFFASILTVLTHHPYASPLASGPVSDPAVAYERYLQALQYSDQVLQELFGELERQGILDTTLVILTGDHGEAFSEHGLITHNGVPFEEVMHVPLILSGKMLGAPRVIGGARQHIDVMPTVFDILGVTYDGLLPGKSLRDPKGHEWLVNACFYENYCLNIFDATGGKTTYFYGKRRPAHYDLVLDPGERDDRINMMSGDAVKGRLGRAFAMKRQYEQVFKRD